MQEKRLFQRWECEVGVTMKRRLGKVGIAAHICDLSLAGAGVTIPDRFVPVGERVELGLLDFPPVRAVVCWSERGRLGLRFEGALAELANSWVGELLGCGDPTLEELLVAA